MYIFPLLAAFWAVFLAIIVSTFFHISHINFAPTMIALFLIGINDEHKGLYDGEFEWSLDKYRKDNHLEKDKTLKETLKSLGLINDK